MRQEVIPEKETEQNIIKQNVIVYFICVYVICIYTRQLLNNSLSEERDIEQIIFIRIERFVNSFNEFRCLAV